MSFNPAEFRLLLQSPPQITTQCDASGKVTHLCLDVESERILQHQRRFAYTIGGPAVVVAGLCLLKDRPLYGLLITALGGACTYWQGAAWHKVENVLASSAPLPPASSPS